MRISNILQILSTLHYNPVLLKIHFGDENEGDSIVSYDIEAETNSMYWDAIPTESTVEDVYPQLGERNTTIVISLSIEAQPSDSTILNITVTEPGEGISSYLLVVLTVLPMYLPSIDASALGQDGLVTLDPGQSVGLSVQISNHGNADTFLLSVDSEPDLAELGQLDLRTRITHKITQREIIQMETEAKVTIQGKQIKRRRRFLRFSCLEILTHRQTPLMIEDMIDMAEETPALMHRPVVV